MRVLVISPAYPPEGTVGVIRMASLTSYLANLGDDVVVIAENCVSDNQKYEVPHGVNVRRVTCSDIICDRSTAYWDEIKICEAEKHFDAAVVSVGPYFTLRFCHRLRDELSIPYILDFRDIGAFDFSSSKSVAQSAWIFLRRLPQIFIEKKAIHAASMVISVTDGWNEQKKRIYHNDAKKMRVIINGYDDVRLKGLDILSRKKEANTIAYIGKLSYYSARYAEMFVRALCKIKEKKPNVKLLHIACEEPELVSLLNKYGFPISNYENTGFLDYPDAMYQLARGSVYFIVDSRKNAIGTKIYDYIFMNRPIIYVGPKSTFLDETVAKFGNGYSCENENEIVEKVLMLMDSNIEELCSDDMRGECARSQSNKTYRKMLAEISEY